MLFSMKAFRNIAKKAAAPLIVAYFLAQSMFGLPNKAAAQPLENQPTYSAKQENYNRIFDDFGKSVVLGGLSGASFWAANEYNGNSMPYIGTALGLGSLFYLSKGIYNMVNSDSNLKKPYPLQYKTEQTLEDAVSSAAWKKTVTNLLLSGASLGISLYCFDRANKTNDPMEKQTYGTGGALFGGSTAYFGWQFGSGIFDLSTQDKTKAEKGQKIQEFLDKENGKIKEYNLNAKNINDLFTQEDNEKYRFLDEQIKGAQSGIANNLVGLGISAAIYTGLNIWANNASDENARNNITCASIPFLVATLGFGVSALDSTDNYIRLNSMK